MSRKGYPGNLKSATFSNSSKYFAATVTGVTDWLIYIVNSSDRSGSSTVETIVTVMGNVTVWL